MHDHETQTHSNNHPDLQCQFPWPSNYFSCNFSSQNWEIVWFWSTRCTHYHEAQDPPPISLATSLSRSTISSFMPIFLTLLTILAATFPQKTMKMSGYVCFAHRCVRCARVIQKQKMSFRRQCPSPPSCQFSWPYDNSSCSFSPKNHENDGICALCAQMRAAHTRSQNGRCHFVGNAHLLLHANYHDPPTILAATFPPKTMKMSGLPRFAHKYARNPKMEDVISSATPISSFVPIFMTLRQF